MRKLALRLNRQRKHQFMNSRTLVSGLLAIGFSTQLLADDVTGERALLCTVLETHVCAPAGPCSEVMAEELNIPRFILLDSKTGKLSTTAASGENRETVAKSIHREAGYLVLQGLESGRAFSLLIEEANGTATFASAGSSFSVSVFAVCTSAAAN